MKSSLTNMVVMLFLITAGGGALVGGVYTLTKERIALAKQHKKLNALVAVLPEFDNDPAGEAEVVEFNGAEHNVFRSRMGGVVNGYAIESFAPGFVDVISVMVGFDMEGNIINVELIEQSETPGLGGKLADRNNPVTTSIIGRNPGDVRLAVRRDGGDVDAITASTVSSRAYLRAVQRAYDVFRTLVVADPEEDTVAIIMEDALDE